MVKCPNKNLPEWKELVQAVGENSAYNLWDQNNGYGLDKAPNGAESKLFVDLLSLYNGDRTKALKAKAKTYSNEFKEWFGDWIQEDKTDVSKVVDENGEPLVVYHHSDKSDITQFSESFDNYFTRVKGGTSKAIFFTGTAHPKKGTVLDRNYIYPVFLSAKSVSERTGSKDELREQGKSFTETINDASETLDAAIFHKIDDNQETDQEIFVVFASNAIKSVDNEGEFSESGNIYNSDESYSVTENIDPTYARNQMFHSEEQTAEDTLGMMMGSDVYMQEPEMKAIAFSMLNSIGGITVKLAYNASHPMQYDANTKTILVSDTIFNHNDADFVSRAFLHELTHAFTVSEYQNNSKFKQRIDKLFDKVSQRFPTKEYGRKGLYYGLTSPYEFISEIYTNPSFRGFVLKNNMSWWQKFIHNVLNNLGFNTLAKNIEEWKVNSVINEIQNIIDNRHSDPTIFENGTGTYNIDYIKELDIKADAIVEQIITGTNSRLRALSSRKFSALKLAKIQEELDNYKILRQKQENKKIICEFVMTAKEQFTPTLTFIRKAYENPDVMANDRIIQFKEDFLNFFGPLVDNINTDLLTQDYFNDLDPVQLDALKTATIGAIQDYKEILGKFKAIVNFRTKEMLNEYAYENGIPMDEVNQYIDDKLNDVNEDINLIQRGVQSIKGLPDLAVRIAYKVMKDIGGKVQIFANNKAQQLIREFNKINRKQVLKYYELDNDGHATGYLVRKLKYGQYKREKKAFMDALDKEYGVIDKNYYALSEDKYHEYRVKREQWLSTHCERRFKPEYYAAYNDLKVEARDRLSALNKKIGEIVSSVSDANGVHLENLSTTNWELLQDLYRTKRNLGNQYQQDGKLKHGDDLAVALDLQKFYKTIGSGKIRKKTLSKLEIQDIIREKKNTLTPQQFQIWVKRNLKYSLSDAFIQLLQSYTKVELDADQKLYDDLREERSKLKNLFKDNQGPRTDVHKMTMDIKSRIKQIDIELARIRKAHSVKSEDISKIAKFEVTQQYKDDEALAKSQGAEAYAKWYKESHYTAYTAFGAKERVVSYYTEIKPVDDDMYDVTLNEVVDEVDKTSPLVNPNFDFSDQEYEQPKKSLYDNSMAYEEATKTPEQRYIYELIKNTITEANEKIGFMVNRDPYKLPQITGDMVDFCLRGNKFWKGIKACTIDKVYVKHDDEQYTLDNFTRNPDNTELNFVATHYIQMLKDPEHISRNLIGSLVQYSRMAENHRLKQLHRADFEIIKEQMRNRRFIGEILPGLNKIGIKPFDRTGGESNMFKAYEDFLKMNLYEQYTSTHDWKGFSLSKLVQIIRDYTSKVNLVHNYSSIAKAFLQGINKSLVEAFAGRYYSASDYMKNNAKMLLNLPRMIWHLGDVKHSYLPLALMELNGISRANDEKIGNLQYNRVVRVIMNHFMWGGWSLVDYITKTPVVESIYNDYKFVPQAKQFMSKRRYIREYFPNNWKEGAKAFNDLDEVTVLDILEVKDGVPVVKEEFKQYEQYYDDNLRNSLRNTSLFITNRIDGILDKEDKTKIMADGIAGAIFVHRAFFTVNIEDNLLVKYQYNPYADDYMESKLRSGARSILQMGKNLIYSIKDRQVKKSKLNDVDMYNVKRIMYQTMLYFIFMALVAAWLKPEADEDKDNLGKQYMGYTFDAVAFDERSEYDPIDAFNKIKNVSATIDPTTNVFDLFTIPFNSRNFDRKITKGPYEGMYPWQKKILKTIPGVKGAIESTDVRTKWDYLKSQLKQ